MSERTDDEWWMDFLWLAPYGVCHYCSTRREQVAAEYEVWFEIKGEMLTGAMGHQDELYCLLHTLCATCTAHCRADERTPIDEDMPIQIVRELQR